ncbi:hypothetical protein GCM10023185_30140 [Hymenobacter saemangeumensis]|uniref:Uncharacterized protein n=1 Tax=Hymenobacter saemangeumensis TaxID=1084522 RepID=A0ABP8IM15_9BACT
MAELLNSTQAWLELLKKFSQEILTDPEFKDGSDNLAQFISDEQRISGWLGSPGATETRGC